MSKKSNSTGTMHCNKNKLEFYYSPTSFSRSSGLSFNEISAPGSRYPNFQYCKGNSSKISLTLEVKLDLNSSEDVYGTYSEFFKGCCPLDNDLLGDTEPPTVSVSLSSGEAFTAILESYESSINHYSKNMNPTDFTFNVSLIEVKGGK